ncbi:putative reverse transcriptase domain-containing protein [Tanacetum coccineum]
MAPKKAPALTEANINRLIQERIDEAIVAERERVQNENNLKVPPPAPTPAPATDPAVNSAPGSAASLATGTATRECTFAGILKCNPTSFHGNEGAVGLSRWIEKSESVFDIIASMGRAVANSKSWTEMKAMMTEEFCPPKEIQIMEHELWNLKVKDYNITAYTTRFNELILLCPEMVPTEKKKVEAYIRGLSENIQGEVTSSSKWEKEWQPVHTLNQFELVLSVETGTTPKTDAQNETTRRKKMLRVAPTQSKMTKCCHCHLIDIKPVKLNTNYEVELADGKIASTNTILRGFMNLVDHLFEIDLMPIKLGSFDVIVGMDWLVRYDVVIVCGKKEVHVPYKNKTLVVKGDRGASQLKVISCIKARKYIERGCHLFLAQVTEKELIGKRVKDVPVIRDFPKVFPDDLPGLPPHRQVEFKFDLVLRATPVPEHRIV